MLPTLTRTREKKRQGLTFYGNTVTACNQVIHLYPDGELRWRVNLRRSTPKDRGREPKNAIVLPSGKTKEEIRAGLAKLERRKPGAKVVIKFLKTSPSWVELAKNKTFTDFAKNTIRRIGGAIEQTFDKNQVQFVTLTVPGSTNQALKAVAMYSGWIMNRIQTYLTDNYQFSTGEKYVFGTVELQKRGALHWHFAIVLEDIRLINKFRIDIENFWYKLLNQLSKKTNIDVFKRAIGGTWQDKWDTIKERAVRSETVYKSVSNYLAKYLSKAHGKNQKLPQYIPSRWWSASDDCKKLMHEKTLIWILPPCSHKQAHTEIKPLIQSMIESAEMWAVDWKNPYTKEDIGIIARSNYETSSEIAEAIALTLKDWLNPNRTERDIQAKAKHHIITETAKERDELDREYWAWLAVHDSKKSVTDCKSPYRKHKKYWELIGESHSWEAAIKAVGY